MDVMQNDASLSRTSLRDVMLSFPARLTCYAVVAMLAVQVVFMGIKTQGPAFVGAENGPVEMAQVYLALLASACFMYAGVRCRRGRAGLITCGAMVGYAAARESDTIFETLFFDDAYKYLVGLPLFLVAVAALAIDRRRVVADALWLVRRPSVTLFALGGIYLCTFCQILDRPEMWASIGSAGESTATKAMVEEFAEVFAYLILGFAGIEALALAHGLDKDHAIATSEDINDSKEESLPRLAA